MYAFEKITKSSAKNKCDNVGHIRDNLIGLHSPKDSVDLMLCPSYSIHTQKKKVRW